MEEVKKTRRRKRRTGKLVPHVQRRLEAILPAAVDESGSSRWLTITDLYSLGIALKLRKKDALMSWIDWYNMTEDVFKNRKTVRLEKHKIEKRMGRHTNVSGNQFRREEFRFKPLARNRKVRQLDLGITV